jgi:tripartite-type tricarboxylate transporter receptor subunit TctC
MNPKNSTPSLRLSRRQLMLAACGAAFAPLHAYAAYPEQIIKLVVGFPPGGGGDTYGRALAAALAKVLGKTVIVDNRAGAGGTIAGSMVARAKPDGYTLLLVLSGSFSAAPAVKSDLPYKVPEDFIPIAKLVDSPYGLVVRGDSPYTSIQDYLQQAKQGKMTFASVGAGGASHIVMEIIKQQAGVDVLHVPYKGAANAMNDLLGGMVDSFINPYVPLMPQIKSGKLRMLAVTGNKRPPGLPNVPTFKEVGLDVDLTLWYGLVAPAGTPADVIAKLTSATKEALKDPELLRTYEADGGQVSPVFGDQFRDLMVRDIEKFKVAVDKAGIRE